MIPLWTANSKIFLSCHISKAEPQIGFSCFRAIEISKYGCYVHIYGGLNKDGFHRVISLNIWCSCWDSLESIRCVLVLSCFMLCGQALRLQSTHAMPSVPLSASCVWIKMWALSYLCCYAFVPPSWTLIFGTICLIKYFILYVAWSCCFVTATEKELRQCLSMYVGEDMIRQEARDERNEEKLHFYVFLCPQM